jgi:hypothetical protein
LPESFFTTKHYYGFFFSLQAQMEKDKTPKAIVKDGNSETQGINLMVIQFLTTP